MSEKRTGLMLSQIRGPLNNLLDNLSGENGDYWLDVLKKILRKEEPPKLPAKTLSFIEALNSKQIASEKIEEWVLLFNSIPAVYRVHESDDEELMDICVSPNLAHFIHGSENDDTALFTLGINGSVRRIGPINHHEITDATFDKWCKNSYENLHAFYEALIELCKMYKDAVPQLVK